MQVVGLGSWLEERCRKEGLSLREATTKKSLSQATIADIIKGARASAETIRKLALAFSQSGNHHRLALEDKLLTLAGYRSKRPEQPELNEPQLRITERFCDFLSQMEEK